MGETANKKRGEGDRGAGQTDRQTRVGSHGLSRAAHCLASSNPSSRRTPRSELSSGSERLTPLLSSFLWLPGTLGMNPDPGAVALKALQGLAPAPLPL